MKLDRHHLKANETLSVYEFIAIDKSLNKYQGKTLFPEKLALANEQLKRVKLPAKLKHRS